MRMPPLRVRALRPLLWLALAAALFGCQQMPRGDEKAAKAPESGSGTPTAANGRDAEAPKAAASSASASGSAGRHVAAAKASAPGTPPPFSHVIKGASRVDGPLTLWQKNDKIWIELLPAQFGKLYFLSPKIKSGITQAFVLGGLMAQPINGAGGAQVVEFVRVHNQVHLQARNTEVVAKAGTPESRAVADAYSNSLLGSTPVVSQPHPDRKSVLIEGNALFLNDLAGVGMMLQSGLHQSYSLDRSNSTVARVRGSEDVTVIEVQQHFYAGNLSASSSGRPPGSPTPTLPRFLPDARSLLVGLHYSISPLPASPMAARPADPRLGLFTTAVLDFSDDLQLTPRQHFVNRWRLEKKDPAAEMSEPVKPITFWIDRNVPLQYRETVRAGVLEWNRAFEKIGFKGAIRVEQQPDDAAFDTLDTGYPSVRWMMNADPVFGAIGPSHVDPRTGEILDADIAFEGLSTRATRTLRAQVLGAQAGTAPAAPAAFAAPFLPPAGAGFAAGLERCMHGALAAEQMTYALDVLEARGELDPDGPIARQFVQDYVKDAIMHEVGHALGLRHNFRASRAYTEAQLADSEYTRANGTSASVMEYNAVNLPSPGKSGGMPFQTALGPYDYWAIEYAYKVLPSGTSPQAERAELQRIAARSSDPLLAYGSDEDNVIGLDPETIQLDLGSDPLAFASKRLEIARDLFRRQETRELPPDRDYAVLRRSINYALNDAARAIGVLVRQIGGVRTLRDFPGSGREPLQPVEAPAQRAALDLIARAVLSTEGLTLSPALQRRLAPDYLARAEGLATTEFSVQQRLLDLQRAVLNYLMSDVIATRILDSVGKFDRPADAFQLGELHARLASEIWAELGARRSVEPARRDLQRDHVNRLALAVVRPTATGRADVRGQLREQARTLLGRLEAATRKPSALDAPTLSHYADSADTLRQALAATIQRQGL